MKSASLLQRMNNLESWLEQSGPQKPALILRMGGYVLLFGTMMILNMVAVIRWPFAALYRLLTPSQTQSRESNTANAILEADKDNLPKSLKNHDTVLLDFWAEWCGPCIMMNEPLKQLGRAEDLDCTIVKVNTVTQPGLAKQYNVKGLPTLVLCRQGQEMKRHAGAMGYAELRAFVTEG